MANELRESFALLPGRADPGIWIAKPGQCSIQKFIGRRSAATRTLPVERPAKYELRRPIVFSSHSPEPMVNQCGLPDSAPSDNSNNIYPLVCPCLVQESDILLSPENLTSC